MTENIAVLQAFHEVKDGLGPGFRTDYERITQAVNGSRPEINLTLFDLPRLEFPGDLSHFSGVIITGSPESVNRPPKYLKLVEELIRKFDQEKKKIFGICFGHQVIANALGGRVGPMEVPWNLGLRTVVPEDCEREILEKAVLWSGAYFALHNEQVLGLPHGFINLASVRNCEYAVMAKGQHILSSQLHPELGKNGFEAIVQHDKYVPAELVSDDDDVLSCDFGEVVTDFFVGDE